MHTFRVWCRVMGTSVLALLIGALVACAPVPAPTPTPDASASTAVPSTTIPTPEFLNTSIAVIGDFGSGDSNEQAVADLIWRWNPEAVVTVGDNVYSDAGYQALVGDFYQPYIDATTFYPATGNHDYQNGINAFDEYFSWLGDQRSYHVLIGSIDVFVLDGATILESETGRDAQMEWLRSESAASTAPYRVVAVHYPPYSSGDQHGSTPDLQWDFASMGVDLVVAGHDHIYERLDVDGMTYVVDGSGGKSLYACDEPRVDGSVICDDTHFGALFLDASVSHLRGQFRAADGTLIDEFTLPATR